MNLKHVFERHLENFFGLLIALNIIHQILASTTLINDYPDWVYYFELFYQVSMVIYVAEIGLRTYLDRRLGFLGWVDAIIVLNYFILGGVYDLRAFRLFRVFEIYKHTRILFPSNTLVRTIYLQRFALLADSVSERSFDVHVNILKLNGPLEDTGFDICSDFVQAFDNGLGSLITDNTAPAQHGGMSHGAVDVEQC